MRLRAKSIRESSNYWRIPREVSTCAPSSSIQSETKFREEEFPYMKSSEMKASPPDEKRTYYSKNCSQSIITKFDIAFSDKTKQSLFFNQKFKLTGPYFFNDQSNIDSLGRSNIYDPPEDAPSNFDNYFCHAPPDQHELIKSYPLQNQTSRAEQFAYERGCCAPHLHSFKLRSFWTRVRPRSTKMNGFSRWRRSSSDQNKYCDHIFIQSTIRLQYLPKCTIPKREECKYTSSRLHAQKNWLAYKIPVSKFRDFNFKQLSGLKLAYKISLHRHWMVTWRLSLKLQFQRALLLQLKKLTFDFFDRSGSVSRFILHNALGRISGKKRGLSSRNLNESLRRNPKISQSQDDLKQSRSDTLNSKSIFNFLIQVAESYLKSDRRQEVAVNKHNHGG
jgi:hypothetical protein